MSDQQPHPYDFLDNPPPVPPQLPQPRKTNSFVWFAAFLCLVGIWYGINYMVKSGDSITKFFDRITAIKSEPDDNPNHTKALAALAQRRRDSSEILQQARVKNLLITADPDSCIAMVSASRWKATSKEDQEQLIMAIVYSWPRGHELRVVTDKNAHTAIAGFQNGYIRFYKDPMTAHLEGNQPN